MGLKITRAAAVVLAMMLGCHSVQALTTLCNQNTKSSCAQNLVNYPLFDTEYKIAANYLPILPLRAITHADLIKAKKSAHLERYFYVKDLTGKFGAAYETMIVDIDVSAIGFFGRKITARGKINEFPLHYENILHGVFPKNAQMQVSASLDGVEILDLDIVSDGTKMTNTVKGTFLSKNTDYHTEWRDTSGMLAGLFYKLHTEGLHKEPETFEVTTSGLIGSSKINGHGILIKPGYYEFEENYGPILVKTKLSIR